MRYVPSSCYILIIDTVDYAGNFERELCAHLTGQTGDCGVGEQYAEKFRTECPKEYEALESLIERQPDDHGNFRPASIYPTPGFWNDGYGTAWPDEAWGTKEAIEKYRETLRERKAKNEAFEEVDPDTAMPGRHPSYQSVAIFFGETVPENLLQFMAARVPTFKSKWGNHPDKVLSIRFVHERIVPQLREIWTSS
jgi:hypothetical protein